MFRVDLKACLGLTNTASSSSGKIEAGFWVILFHGPYPWSLLYSTIVLYDAYKPPAIQSDYLTNVVGDSFCYNELDC